MKKIQLNISYTEFESADELSASDRDLLKQAGLVLENAYAPYSGYKVGAAVELENGEIITGNNQENVAFPSGICAERVAIFSASSKYPGVRIKSIAICSSAKDFKVNSPVLPCGSCRQVMAEYENNQDSKIRIILSGETGKVFLVDGIENLLPLRFKADQLKI